MTKEELKSKLNAHSERIFFLEGNDFSSEATVFIAVGGIHGNEKSGPTALNNTKNWIKETLPKLPNKLCCIGLKGNAKALENSTRFIHRDLNRMWTNEIIEDFKKGLFDKNCHEFQELKELIEILRLFFFNGYKNIVVLDMHTTSAKGGKFFISNEDKYSEALSKKLNIPLIVNLKRVIQGPMINHLEEEGAIGIVIEAGQHIEPEAVTVLEKVIKNLTLFLGNDDTLSSIKNKNNTAKVRFKYRHPVKDEDEFKMRPGYANFQKVTEGTTLADDKKGEIKAPFSGILIMPLYQKKGEDGFFIAEEVD